MPIPLLAKLLEGLSGSATQFASGSTIDFMQTVAAGETPMLGRLYQELNETSGHLNLIELSQSPSFSQDQADEPDLTEHHVEWKIKQWVIEEKREVEDGISSEEVPDRQERLPENKQPDRDAPSPVQRANNQQPEPGVVDDKSSNREVPSPTERASHDTKQSSEYQFEESNTDNTLEENRRLAQWIVNNLQLFEREFIQEYLEDQRRKDKQLVIDGQGRTISLRQHEENIKREIENEKLRIQLEIAGIAAGSFSGALGVGYGMLLTNDRQQIRAWGYLFNAFGGFVNPKSQTPQAVPPISFINPKSQIPQAVPLRNARLVSRKNATSGNNSKKGRSATTRNYRNSSGTYIGRNGKRYFNNKGQPGMRGPKKLPQLGDRDPDFFTTGASFYDHPLPEHKNGSRASDKVQFRDAMRALKKQWKDDPSFKERFTKLEQERFLEAFGNMNSEGVSSVRVKGFTWHHSTDAFGGEGGGWIQLLDFDLHKANPHFGGRFITGGPR